MKLLIRAFVVAGMSGVAAGAVAQQDCPPGTVKIGERRTETATEIIVQPRCRRIASMTDAELLGHYTRVKTLVQGDRARMDAFRSKYLPQLQGQIEEWEGLAEHARREVYVSALNAALVSALRQKAIAGEMQRKLLQRELKDIRAAIKVSSPMSEARGELELVTAELQRAKQVGDLVKAAERLQAFGVQQSQAVKADGTYERVLYGLLGAIHAVAHDPATQVVLAGGEMGMALLWEHRVLNVGLERVEQLSSVAESELVAIAKIASVYGPRAVELGELRRAANARGLAVAN